MARSAAAVRPPAASWSSASPAFLDTGWEAPALLLLTVSLLSAGLVMVYSASSMMAQSHGLPDYYYVVRQTVAATVGMIALAISSQIDYRRYRILAWPMLIVVVVLLIVTVMPGTTAIAPRINGGR